MFKKAGQILKEIRGKIVGSANVGKKALAITLALALVTASVPAIGVTADAETVNASDNKGFRVVAYDQSVRMQIPMVSGATNYKVYLSQDGNLTSFSGASCVFDSGYESYAYAVSGDKDAANSSNTISISENNTYYFYLVTNDGTQSTVQSSVEVATRPKDSCYWTSPGVYDSGWYSAQTGDTYTISTAAQLAGLAVLVSDGNDFSGKTVKLTASVDLSAYLWTPIGTADATTRTMSPFKGTFDGGNYDGVTLTGSNVVSGLHTNDGTKDYQGLFGLAGDGSTIKNVGAVNGSVKGAKGVGGVTGITEGAITNCYNTGSVSGTDRDVGGVAGDAEGTVTKCYNTGLVSGADKDVGGVAGYTWTFKGADLAKSTTSVTDVNIAMAIRLTTEVPKVNQLTPDNTGLVLMFDHSGQLPSTASLTFSAKEKGFKPGQKLYFYFYNASTGELESQAQEYTVDADGNVTVQISHCSNYVLLPNKARTITLDTRTYTMPVGSSYITGVKLTGVFGAKLKAYSSTRGVADVTVLKNGNVMATGKKPGLTYIMIDVYDSKNKFLTHASVRLTVKKIVKPNGNSARQYGIF